MTRLLTQNFLWKLFSLALATLLWFAFIGQPETSVSVAGTIQYRNIPADLEISSEITDSALLDIRGPANKLSRADTAGLTVILDLAELTRPGDHTLSISEENTVLPGGVRLTRSVPAQVRLHLERRLIKDVPVQVRFDGPPPAGYRVLAQEVSPPSLVIVGPESKVNQTDSVQTDPIDLSAATQESVFKINTYVGDPHLRFLRSSVVTVKVALERTR
jgi:YbbR domain-containing protein